MRKKINLSIIELCTIVFLTFLCALSLLKIPDIISTINIDNAESINSYLGVIGNISGGIIGGIVAYFVAAYQVSKSTEQHIQRSLKESYATMYLLQDEIEYNYTVLKKTCLSKEDIQTKSSHLKKQLFISQWENVNPMFAQHIDSDKFKDICDLYRTIQFIILNYESIDSNFISTAKERAESVKINLDKEIKNIYEKIT